MFFNMPGIPAATHDSVVATYGPIDPRINLSDLKHSKSLQSNRIKLREIGGTNEKTSRFSKSNTTGYKMSRDNQMHTMHTRSLQHASVVQLYAQDRISCLEH